MIDILLICLNDESDIENMLKSIFNGFYEKLVIVDGGSKDNTEKIARKYTKHFYKAKKGMVSQTKYGLDFIDAPYVFIAEADHQYPKNFLNNLLKELKETKFDGIKATLTIKDPSNFWEWLQKKYYYINHYEKGEREIIACPQLWDTKSFKKLMIEVEGSEGYSFDTKRAEISKKLNLKVGIGETIAYGDQKVSFKRLLRRWINYGKGDYEFFKENQSNWGIKRKIKSISHIAKRYFIILPIKTFLYKQNILLILFLYFFGTVRYLSWIFNFIKNN